MTDEVVKSFVIKFNKWLKHQINNQALSSDGLESLEVAIQCLEAAFDVHTSDDTAGGGEMQPTIEPIDLFEIYRTAVLDATPDRKELAENIKNDGNRLMKESKFQEALLEYNRAISYDPKNPVFYSNRAAAYIRLGQFDKAVTDCKMALVYNPDYGKAYGRMGIAYSNLNKFEEARSAYQKALELEPDNQDYQNNLRVAEERLTSGAGSGAGAGAGVGINVGGNAAGVPNMQAFLTALQGGGNSPDFGPNLTNMFGDMLRDPVITTALHSLAANPQGIIDMSRQVAAAISEENPNLMQTLMNAMRRNDGGNQQPNSNNTNNARGEGPTE